MSIYLELCVKMKNNKKKNLDVDRNKLRNAFLCLKGFIEIKRKRNYLNESKLK